MTAKTDFQRWVELGERITPGPWNGELIKSESKEELTKYAIAFIERSETTDVACLTRGMKLICIAGNGPTSLANIEFIALSRSMPAKVKALVEAAQTIIDHLGVNTEGQYRVLEEALKELTGAFGGNNESCSDSP